MARQCELTCLGRGPDNGCNPNSNCAVKGVQWTEGCVVSQPSAYTETIDFGDGTNQTLQTATQGCGFLPCPAASTTYNLQYNHTYTAANTFNVKVTVHDTLNNQQCTVSFAETVVQ
jgi:hypothetical protein